MKVYITGRIPPVCHVDPKCFGILFHPRLVEVENLSGLPDYYEHCPFCNPIGMEKLDSGQRGRAEELRSLLGE